MFMWSIQMPTDDKKEEKQPSRVERFIYNKEDVDRIFQAGRPEASVGNVIPAGSGTILLKKMLPK